MQPSIWTLQGSFYFLKFDYTFLLKFWFSISLFNTSMGSGSNFRTQIVRKQLFEHVKEDLKEYILDFGT